MTAWEASTIGRVSDTPNTTSCPDSSLYQIGRVPWVALESVRIADFYPIRPLSMPGLGYRRWREIRKVSAEIVRNGAALAVLVGGAELTRARDLGTRERWGGPMRSAIAKGERRAES
jgi:hypothetical protein